MSFDHTGRPGQLDQQGGPRLRAVKDDAPEAPDVVADTGLLAESEHGTDLFAGDALALDGAGERRPVDGHLIELPRQGIGSRLVGAVGGGTDRPEGEPVPVLPAWARDRVVAGESARRAGRELGHWVAFRAVRLPVDVLRIGFYALRGAASLTLRLLAWAWDLDGHPLIGEVTAKDDRAYVRMANDRTVRQRSRFIVIGLGLLLVAVLAGAAKVWAPWTLPVALVVVLGLLARAGKPVGVRMVSPVLQRELRMPLTSQSIVSALSAVGITALTKALAEPHMTAQIWRSGIVAVRGGHRVQIKLPHGVLAVDLVPHEQRLAHALGRQADTVIVQPLPEVTPGDLLLHVRDKPALSVHRGPGPLAKARRTSWWTPVAVGVTRLGVAHTVALKGGAHFVGGQPNSGKSSLLKIDAAHTALDPYALLTIINLKGSPDYVGLKPVAHRYLSGSPETDRTVIAQAHRLLEEAMADVAHRNDLLSRLVEQGKAETTEVTEELAKAYPQLRPHTLVIDEVHRLFDPADNPQAEETADLLAKLIKACRSVAYTIDAATQLAGTESVPPALTRAARIRGCLCVQDEVSFRQIFGNSGGRGAFAASGVSALPQGTVILKAEDGAALKVGTYYLTPGHLAEIGRRALALRSTLDLLTGDAAGEQLAQVERTDPADLLRDVLPLIAGTAPTGGRKDGDVAWLAELESALSQAVPAVYGDRADGWLSAELRSRGVPTAGVNRRYSDATGAPKQRTTAGVTATAVRAALDRMLTPADSKEIHGE